MSLSTGMRLAGVTLYSVDSPSRNDPLLGESFYGAYVKGVTSANKVQNADFSVQVLAVQSGGRVLNTHSDIGGSIASCLDDAKVYYTLSFDAPPAKHPNEYHSLQIKMGKPGLAARPAWDITPSLSDRASSPAQSGGFAYTPPSTLLQ